MEAGRSVVARVSCAQSQARSTAALAGDRRPPGFGRIFKIGDQPVSANIAAYYNVINPTGAPNWQLRAQLSLLFPNKISRRTSALGHVLTAPPWQELVYAGLCARNRETLIGI